VAEDLPSKHEALSSNATTAKNEKVVGRFALKKRRLAGN
jgi:hypothetical protein